MRAPATHGLRTRQREGSTIEDRSGLNAYLREINRVALLTADEEKELARVIHRAEDLREQFGQDPEACPSHAKLAELEQAEEDSSAARERMVKSNLRLVVNIAKKYSKRGMPSGKSPISG